MPYVESFKEFVQRQDCEWVLARGGFEPLFLFENGAVWNGSENGYDRGTDPPADVFTLKKVKRDFTQAKLERITHARNKQREFIDQQATFHVKYHGPSPTDTDLEQYEKQCEIVAELEEQLEQLDLEITCLFPEETKPPKIVVDLAQAAQREREVRQRLHEIDAKYQS